MIYSQSLLKSPKSLRVFEIINVVSKRADARKILNVDKYIGALGLTVSPHLRGQKLGQRMLEARWDNSIPNRGFFYFLRDGW